MPFLHPTYILSLLIAVTIHEWSHAITATALGDPTPRDAGRLSLSPLAHLDLLGALLFLTVGFGWAKPVPINPSHFRHHKRGTCLTAIAGPLSNLILALLSLIILTMIGVTGGDSAWNLLDSSLTGSIGRAFVIQLCSFSLFVNLGLMAFNILPIAPLDGSNVLAAFIPYRLSDRYEEFRRIGPYIIFGLFMAEAFLGVRILSLWIVGIMDAVLEMIQSIVGAIM